MTSSSISGYVLDPSRKTIPNAMVSLNAAEKGLHRTAEADSHGFYVFSPLPTGVYEIAAKAIRFAETKLSGIVLAVDSPRRVDLFLAVLDQGTAVAVQSKVSPVLAESSDLGAVVGRDDP